jgi:hypothetical protein
MESYSLGSRGLRLKLHGILAHGKLHRQTTLGNYLRQHVGGGVGSHLDRRCEKPESLRFAHEGQRMVAGVDLLTYVSCCAHRIDNGFEEGRGQVTVEVEKGEFVCSWKSSYDTLRFQCGRLLPAPKYQAPMQQASKLAGRSSLRTPCQKERQLCKYTQPCPNVVADSCIIEQHAYIPTRLTTAFEQVPLADISPFTASKIQCSASIWTLSPERTAVEKSNKFNTTQTWEF